MLQCPSNSPSILSANTQTEFSDSETDQRSDLRQRSCEISAQIPYGPADSLCTTVACRTSSLSGGSSKFRASTQHLQSRNVHHTSTQVGGFLGQQCKSRLGKQSTEMHAAEAVIVPAAPTETITQTTATATSNIEGKQDQTGNAAPKPQWPVLATEPEQNVPKVPTRINASDIVSNRNAWLQSNGSIVGPTKRGRQSEPKRPRGRPPKRQQIATADSPVAFAIGASPTCTDTGSTPGQKGRKTPKKCNGKHGTPTSHQLSKSGACQPVMGGSMLPVMMPATSAAPSSIHPKLQVPTACGVQPSASAAVSVIPTLPLTLQPGRGPGEGSVSLPAGCLQGLLPALVPGTGLSTRLAGGLPPGCQILGAAEDLHKLAALLASCHAKSASTLIQELAVPPSNMSTSSAEQDKAATNTVPSTVPAAAPGMAQGAVMLPVPTQVGSVHNSSGQKLPSASVPVILPTVVTAGAAMVPPGAVPLPVMSSAIAAMPQSLTPPSLQAIQQAISGQTCTAGQPVTHMAVCRLSVRSVQYLEQLMETTQARKAVPASSEQVRLSVRNLIASPTLSRAASHQTEAEQASASPAPTPEQLQQALKTGDTKVAAAQRVAVKKHAKASKIQRPKGYSSDMPPAYRASQALSKSAKHTVRAAASGTTTGRPIKQSAKLHRTRRRSDRDIGIEAVQAVAAILNSAADTSHKQSPPERSNSGGLAQCLSRNGSQPCSLASLHQGLRFEGDLTIADVIEAFQLRNAYDWDEDLGAKKVRNVHIDPTVAVQHLISIFDVAAPHSNCMGRQPQRCNRCSHRISHLCMCCRRNQ